MDLLIFGVIVLVVVAYCLYYYHSSKKTPTPSVPYKVETPAPVAMDETFDAPVVNINPAQEPAKMAKPKLTKVEGGTKTKPAKIAKSKPASEQKGQKPQNKKPKAPKKPTA